MPKIKEAAAEFLANKRIAVTGVSRNPKGGHGSNIVYQRLRQRGYEVVAVNPTPTPSRAIAATPTWGRSRVAWTRW